MAHAQLVLILGCLFGFFMAWGIGANDVANAMGTSVGSKALTIKQAIIIAAVFETLGAVLAGGEVTQTIRNGIIDPNLFASSPDLLVYGMLASMLAAGTWLLVASYFGWPVSTTHSIVGAIIGFAWIELGASAVEWNVVSGIALSWIVTPFIAGVIAYFVLVSIQRLIFNAEDPLRNAKIYIPFYIFFVAFVILMVTLISGLSHLRLDISFWQSTLIATASGILVALLSMHMLKRVEFKKGVRMHTNVERIFSVLMIFTACVMAFAHGSNDIANAMGPMAAVVNLVQSGGDVNANAPLPIWILFFGAFGVVLGLAMYGYKVIETIGGGITDLSPSRGFAASLATATTVVIASGAGLPISTTQTLVGAVMGVGFARGIYALNMGVIRNIVMSWLITLPAGALLSIVFFEILDTLLS